MHLKPSITNHYLAAIFLNRKKALNNKDSNEIDILFKLQLDLAIDQTQLDNNLLDVSTKIL